MTRTKQLLRVQLYVLNFYKSFSSITNAYLSAIVPIIIKVTA